MATRLRDVTSRVAITSSTNMTGIVARGASPIPASGMTPKINTTSSTQKRGETRLA